MRSPFANVEDRHCELASQPLARRAGKKVIRSSNHLVLTETMFDRLVHLQDLRHRIATIVALW